MSSSGNALLRHQQSRWLRPDAARWVRPDAARYLAPNADVLAAFPALQRKYSPDQPRVPKGNGDESGRWAKVGASGRSRVYIYGTDQEGDSGSADSVELSSPMGSLDLGDVAGEINSLDLFGVTPGERDNGGVQLAGDPPPGIGDNGGPDLEEPPEIPRQRPTESWQRTAAQRALANWLIRRSIVSEAAVGIIRSYEWLRAYEDAITAAADSAKSLSELQGDLSPKAGYERHHIAEKTAAQYWGFAKDETEDPDNLVMIPRLKHYQITGWYGSENPRYGGLSPRDYLSDKGWEERRRVGLDALELFGVLKR